MKYKQIVSWVTEEIAQKKLLPGNKLPSERELQELFQVSRQTVRRALEELEKKEITESFQGSGTFIKADTMRKERTMRIAVMTTYIDVYIFPAIIKEIEKLLSKSGYGLQIAVTNNAVEKERMLLKGFLKDQSIDGLIAETTKSGLPNPNLDLYRQLQKAGISVLFLNSYYEELDFPHVSMDDRMAGKLVTEHLLQCGHHKIAGIFKADDGQGHKRYAGYIEALMNADIRVKGDRIVWIDTEELQTMRDGFARILKRVAGCTACVCYNDEVANKLIGICLEQGIKVPEDLSIVGIDNSDLSKFCEVPFTSAKNPVHDLGRIAAQKMLEMTEKQHEVENVELEPKLVIRNSVRVL